jgi:hypothetical protein
MTLNRARNVLTILFTTSRHAPDTTSEAAVTNQHMHGHAGLLNRSQMET